MLRMKIIFRLLPWLLLVVMAFVLYFSKIRFFGADRQIEVIESTTILKEIEQLGRLELVKYNFKEIFDYKQISDGKIIGNSILRLQDYSPDLNVVLVASGEAVGCIDLTKIKETDIQLTEDTVFVLLPSPELCYHKLDLENTRIYSFKNNSWWSKLFSDDDNDEEVLQAAYRETEKRIELAAYESGILDKTNEQAKIMMRALLESTTGKKVKVIAGIPDIPIVLD